MDRVDKEYKRLSRQELLELLIEESEKTEELERQLNVLKAQLASREIKICEAGSIAEAALSLNGIFEAAQNACAQYIENIERLSYMQDKTNIERETECRENT